MQVIAAISQRLAVAGFGAERWQAKPSQAKPRQAKPRQKAAFYLAGKIIAIVLLSCWLSGCSKLGFTYRNLDWLLTYYVDDYVSLNARQEDLLSDKVRVLLAWHCKNEIPDYLDLLAKWQAMATSNTLSKAQYDSQRDSVLRHWRILIKRLADEMKPLVVTANETQLKEFIQNLQEKNAEFKEEYIENDIAEVREKLEEHLQERYERWLGSLTRQQQSLIRGHSQVLAIFQKAIYTYRENWRELLMTEWQKSHDMAAVADFLYNAVTDRERYWSPQYRLKYYNQRQASEKLTFSILTSLSAGQSAYLKNKLKDLQAQLREIECPTYNA